MGDKKVADVGYAVFGSSNFDRLEQLQENLDVDAFLNLGPNVVRSLGSVTFASGTTNASSNQLAKWTETMTGFPAGGWVFTRPGESTTEDVDAQVNEILTLTGAPMGGNTLTPKLLESKTEEQWPAGADLVCIFGGAEIG